jgi:hypothetical protein
MVLSQERVVPDQMFLVLLLLTHQVGRCLDTLSSDAADRQVLLSCQVDSCVDIAVSIAADRSMVVLSH